ncbi:hypothetical protein [Cellulomonas composti]|uniref:Uncharacterized protein n=1 Tax=Cellulomonas composti TaxID=266130 RepID=A0A511JCQ5_9CELL|nr:hypothetical protein [Cellulomonas composti]GEL95781.1 hypothetical protein CCO02nite_24390 [Cellulomonas composti]
MSTADPAGSATGRPTDATDPATAEPASPSAPVDAPEPAAETGKHAVVRPAPVPPPPAPETDAAAPLIRTSYRDAPPIGAPAAAAASTAAAAPTPAPAPAPTPAPAPAPAPVPTVTAEQPIVAAPPAASSAETTATLPPIAAAPIAAAPMTAARVGAAPAAAAPAATTELFPEPNAPTSTSKGTHVLGALVGILLAPIGAAVLLLGQARILAEQAPQWDGTLDVAGVVLVGVGLLSLVWVALLGLWTPAAPIAGGAVLTLVGGFALVLPGVAHEQVLAVLDSSGWKLTITQVTVAGTSGTLVTVGTLMLVGGIVAGAARRRGVRIGEFRARHR